MQRPALLAVKNRFPLIIRDNDAARGDDALCHHKPGWNNAIGKQSLARAQCERIDHQPERIDQIVLEERLHEVAASPNMQIVSWLLFDSGDFFCNIAAQKYGRLPCAGRPGVRSDVLRSRVDVRPYLWVLRPIRLPNFKGFPPQQQIEGQVHLPSDGRSKRIVGKATDPSAMREAAAGIFLWSAWSLNDAVERDVFKNS